MVRACAWPPSTGSRVLSFHAVLLTSIDASHVPARPRAWYELESEEQTAFDLRQRCLLYVAATRARDHLTVTGTGTPSPFLASE